MNGARGIIVGFSWPNEANDQAKKGDLPQKVYVKFHDLQSTCTSSELCHIRRIVRARSCSNRTSHSQVLWETRSNTTKYTVTITILLGSYYT